MSNLKNIFKDNIVAPYNKYSISQEKLAEVLDTNEDRNVCTISYKNIDGILTIKEDVPVKKSSLRGILGGFPKTGDYVEIEEVGKVIRITGLVDKSRLTAEKSSNNDTHSGPATFSGNLGF